MAAHSRMLDSPPLTAQSQEDDVGQTTSRAASSLGSSRQTRRLQLRNAGFRGSALPSRRVTPKSVPSSSWSSVSGVNGSSDIENVAPSWARPGSAAGHRRESSGVLLEVGNSTMKRPQKTRQRVSSGKRFETDISGQDTVYAGMPTSPPPPPKSTVRRRSAKSHPKVIHRRRSPSSETSKYIEHLEGELASTQSQLSALSSPATIKKQDSKVRSLNAETKQLQQELADWETKYEQRLQEALNQHYTVETDLRAGIRHLEQDAEDAKFRIQELESHLQTATQNTEAVETANVNLEKRLEIMSELLASTKIDLHAETPGRSRKNMRPRSMLPRFPTASSLMSSPERHPQTQPTSPLLSFTNQYSPILPSSPCHSILPLDNSPLHSDFTSEVESVFSEAHSVAGDSMTSAENNFEVAQPNFNPWSLPLQQQDSNTKAKPARRMRRFGAGSVGPKPLILPSTSNCDMLPPASAPPLERSETTPAFFPETVRKVELSDSPLLARRRASTMANEKTILCSKPPFQDIAECSFDEDDEESVSTPLSDQSPEVTRRYSSFDPPAGRNLMEELTAARSTASEGSATQSTKTADNSDEWAPQNHGEDLPNEVEILPSPSLETTNDLTSPETSEISLQSKSSVTAVPCHRRSRSHSNNIPAVHAKQSIVQRLRILFGDLWHSPVALARHLIQAAQARMRIPQPLLNVQWWLVGVLLGPMAKRRLLNSAHRCEDIEEQRLLLGGGVADEAMAYGTTGETTPALPARVRSVSLVTGKGRKRAGSKTRCAYHHYRRKHSPLLWIKFSITLAFAIGAAFKDGPGSLLERPACPCRRKGSRVDEM